MKRYMIAMIILNIAVLTLIACNPFNWPPCDDPTDNNPYLGMMY